MELQEIREGFSEKKTWERNVRHFVGNYRREFLHFLRLGYLLLLLSFVQHHLVVITVLLPLLAFLSHLLIFISSLVFLAVAHPLPQLLACCHDTPQLHFQEVVEFIPDHVLTAIVTQTFLHFVDLLNLGNKTLLYF